MDEQKALQEALDANKETSDELPTRDAILAELHLYSVGINTRKWAHKKQKLDDEIAFAATDAGKAADLVLDAEMKEQRKVKDKEKKQRRREKLAAEKKNKKEIKPKFPNKSQAAKNKTQDGLKMGQHVVKNKDKDHKKEKKAGGKDRVNKKGNPSKNRGKKFASKK